MISLENILKFENREKIYSYISKNPGLHLREISRRMEIPKTTIEYHLKFLMKMGIIIQKSDGKYKRFYIVNKVSAENKKILNLLRKEIPCKIIIYLAFGQVFTRDEISNELGIHPDRARYYLNKLEKMNIIEKVHAQGGVVPVLPKQDCKVIIEKKYIGREFFYRRKSSEALNKIWQVLISNKDSLPEKIYIDLLIEHIKNLSVLGIIGERFAERAKERIIQKNGKKITYLKYYNEEKFYEALTDLIKPFFIA